LASDINLSALWEVLWGTGDYLDLDEAA